MFIFLIFGKHNKVYGSIVPTSISLIVTRNLYFDNDIGKFNYHILKSIVLIQKNSFIIILHGHFPVKMELIQRLTRAKLHH